MKWFKHDTDARESEKMMPLIQEFGLLGYARWFILLEIIAEKMDKTDRCHVRYPSLKWGKLLQLKQKKLEIFLELCENSLETKIERSGLFIKISVPNLLKKRDEYSKKSRYSPKNVPPKNEEKRLNNKEEHNKTLHGGYFENGVMNMKQYTLFKKRFNTVWNLYPRKINRHAAEKSFMSHVKKEGLDYFRELAFAVRCENRLEFNARVMKKPRSPPPGYIFFDTSYKDHADNFKHKIIPALYRRFYKL